MPRKDPYELLETLMQVRQEQELGRGCYVYHGGLTWLTHRYEETA